MRLSAVVDPVGKPRRSTCHYCSFSGARSQFFGTHVEIADPPMIIQLCAARSLPSHEVSYGNEAEGGEINERFSS